MINDATLLALCVYDEARGEDADGKAAVARVVLNRMKHHYSSDGTVAGTVLAPNQFSGFWFDMVKGHYTRVCHTLPEAWDRAENKLDDALKHPAAWAACMAAASAVQAGTYHSPAYDMLTDAAVLYLNPSISKAAWATPDKHVCDIGHHAFYRA